MRYNIDRSGRVLLIRVSVGGEDVCLHEARYLGGLKRVSALYYMTSPRRFRSTVVSIVFHVAETACNGKTVVVACSP